MKNNRTIKYFQLFVILIVLILSIFPYPAYAIGIHNFTTIVNGKADAVCDDVVDIDGNTCDVERVQAAVDKGGKVLLRGEFHFVQFDPISGIEKIGTDQFVDIRNDIEIYGEKRGNTYLTKVVGGQATFRSGVEYINLLPILGIDKEWPWENDDTPHSITIKGIHFENPYVSSIHILKYNNVVIQGNKFTGGRLLDIRPFSDTGYSVNVWIGTFNLFNFAEITQASGRVIIKENIFNGMWKTVNPEDDPWAVETVMGTFHRGSTVGFWTWRTVSDISIVNNYLDNMGNISHHLQVNYNCGPTTINYNTVISPYGAGGIVFNTRPWLYELDLGHSYCTETGFGPLQIKNNKVEMSNDEIQYGAGIDIWNGGSAWGDFIKGIVVNSNSIVNPKGSSGITISGMDSEVKDNQIVSEFSGILGFGISASTFQNNKITLANGAYGIKLESNWTDPNFSYEDYGSTGNIVKDNEIDGSASFGVVIGNFADDCTPVTGSECASSTENTIKNNDLEDLKLTPHPMFGGLTSHYAFLDTTINNILKGNELDVIWDFTSDFNPYDPETYNGVNNIMLGYK